MAPPSSILGTSPGTARLSDEFPPGAPHWLPDLDRREFLRLMGASLALAGLSSCRRPAEKIVARVVPPDRAFASGTAWYATAMPWEGFARGVLAKSWQGRPIKLEGNPDHPESRGATDAETQAAILSLYDPERSTGPRRGGQAASWERFEQEWTARRPEFAARRGAGLAVLTEPTTSPTLRRELHALLAAWPEARWFQHTPLARHDRDGWQADFDFAAADLVLTLGADCFHRHPAALRQAGDFFSRRRRDATRRSRLYALEPTPSLTGAAADYRAPVAPGRFPLVLNALAAALGGRAPSAELTEPERALVRDCAARLAGGGTKGICIAGPEIPEEQQRWVDAFNARYARGAARRLAAVRSDGDAQSGGGLGELVAALDRGGISTLWILGANPAYTAPGDLDFSGALRRAEFTVHVGGHADETAARCGWHLPEAHFLETWSDLRAYSGAATILQPLVEPLHGGRSPVEIAHLLRTGERRGARELVRETWSRGVEDASFEARWHEWLDRGVVEEAPAEAAPAAAAASGLPLLVEGTAAAEIAVLFRPDPNLADGRWATNAWLQELPRPFTSLVWENAALVSPATAAKFSLRNGDIIRCEAGGRAVEAPVWSLPGQADGCVTLPLGGGRTAAGPVGSGRGFSAYPLRAVREPWERVVSLRPTGGHRDLVTTQGHFTMDGRDLARTVPEENPSLPPAERTEAVALFPTWPRDRYAWALSIDLDACFGCSACVVACQAENNIPVVGRDQVARGREMHWIRVDRYFSGDAANPRVLHQPVPCMHCEQAPCEVVCPVGATVHSSEGLNDMIYNRCVGTRYCSNNCPYKVRRFNFLDYRAPAESGVYLQANPAVTIRERGVMEKCTYCVQRIDAGRIAAEKENRRVRDGEILTACQQACPAGAIVFGDLNDPASRVARRRRDPMSYALLAELNTRPRTTYLAKILPASPLAAQDGSRPDPQSRADG
ncbi:MAG TPA: 4Fe-4S dicluster domain-containing protein [Opitutaceae bacterium]|nr:4Fe-4S dicluster domain-containing protein [Opitutaceae bacterium]